MTQLDEFTIDFKTKATAQTRAEIAAIDKQLADMDAKGKKRSDIEEKEYQRLKKHRKELLDETKQQQRETDKLADSFATVAENILGAVTAFATFGAIKSGIFDAAKYNASIKETAFVTGQAEDELASYAAMVQSFGGDANSFVQAQYAMAQATAKTGIQYKNVGAFLDSMHEKIKGLPKQEQLRQLALAHLTDLPLVYALEQSDKDYYGGLKKFKENLPSPEDRDKALEFLNAYQDFGTALTTAYSRLGSDVLPTVSAGLKEFNEHLKEIEQQKGGIETFFTETAAVAIGAWTPLGRLIAGIIVGTAQIYGAAKDIAAGGGTSSLIGKGANSVAENILDFLQPGFEPGLKKYRDDQAKKTTATLSQPVELTGTEGDKDFGDEDYLTQLDNARKQKKAQQLATNYHPPLFSSYGLGDTTTQTQSIKIDEVTINTQATDAAGIASAFKEAFNREYHTAYSAIDDGQDR